MEIKHLNRTYMIGNLGADPESRTFAAGSRKVTLRLAVSNDYKKKDSDEWVKRDPTWIDCECWGEVASQADALRKGNRIALSGKLIQDTWEDKTTGMKRSKHYINVFEFEVQEKKGGGEQSSPSDYRTPAVRASSSNEQDIPF